MLRRALILFTVLLLPFGARAQEGPGPAIEGVISDQLGAFVARDIDGAWQHASPMIQGMFGTPENFAGMVQRGYPMVWDNGEVRFAELREIAGVQVQRVYIRDDSGQLHVLEYQMVELDGVWRINGVSILPAPDVGV